MVTKLEGGGGGKALVVETCRTFNQLINCVDVRLRPYLLINFLLLTKYINIITYKKVLSFASYGSGWILPRFGSDFRGRIGSRSRP